MSSRT